MPKLYTNSVQVQHETRVSSTPCQHSVRFVTGVPEAKSGSRMTNPRSVYIVLYDGEHYNGDEANFETHAKRRGRIETSNLTFLAKFPEKYEATTGKPER